jgi:hypothetical protein
MISELLSRAGGYNGQDIYGYIAGNCMWCVNRKENTRWFPVFRYTPHCQATGDFCVHVRH